MAETMLFLLSVAAIGFVVLALYFLPALVSLWKGQENLISTIAINAVLGWTGIGWLALLLWVIFHKQEGLL